MHYTEDDIRTVLKRVRGEDDGSPELPEAEPPNPARVTARGTRCAGAWDDDWIAAVEAREAELDRRICGARTPAGTPCRFGSTHESGRCRYHGGFDLTGAPEGNRNAVIHGLYSRRLTVCGRHCPAWASCPLGGGTSRSKVDPVERAKEPACTIVDELIERTHVMTVEAAKKFYGQNKTAKPGAGSAHAVSHDASRGDDIVIPPDEMPTCPYEQAEYNAAVTDATQSAWRREHADPYSKHVAHTLALVQVMVSRAALALRHQGFTETMKVTGKNYNMETSKPSAAFTAFLKLQREYRQMVALTRPDLFQPRIEDRVAYELRCDTDTRVDADAPPPASPAALYAIKEKADKIEVDRRDADWQSDKAAALVSIVAELEAATAHRTNDASDEYAWLKKDPLDDESLTFSLEKEKVSKEKPIPKQRE